MCACLCDIVKSVKHLFLPIVHCAKINKSLMMYIVCFESSVECGIAIEVHCTVVLLSR